MFIFQFLLLFYTIVAASSPATCSNASVYFSGSDFISSPSIYSYTIESQTPFKKNYTQKLHDYNEQWRTVQHYNNPYRNNRPNVNKNRHSSITPIIPLVTTGRTTSARPEEINNCGLDGLAVYKIVLQTYWTRELFPKHYPDWRPTAQWTKTVGCSHDSSYILYRLGRLASAGVKQFAETGKSDIFDNTSGDQQQQLKKSMPSQNIVANKSGFSVFDEFNLPAIITGAGRSESKFFVDSNHSLISLMTRVVPSPDWFIGIDSFQLCLGGSWIDKVTIEMDPLDAGSDNGFTFTAPNWPTSPQGVIYRITSKYPAHPAGSFFYPTNKRLPPIATVQLMKLKEYELSEVFHFAEDDRKYEVVHTQTHLEMEHNHVEMNNELSASIEQERQNEIAKQPTFLTEKDRIRSQLLAKMNPLNDTLFNKSADVPKNDRKAIILNIASSYGNSKSLLASSPSLTGYPSIVKRHRAKRVRDCRVSHWSEWSVCSKTCGVGEMHRYRKIIKHGKRGGRPCPPLMQSKWCGADIRCHLPNAYFNWSNS
ncbi:uncharacterized protein LOC119638316 isoform X2 [Glossina fuscipes]|uniref:Uncharacterized protein LOC119638316 isoform X2 n=1 Tax=Glossina fuscipes TaxID=7396 RepID=A0A9C5Z7L1_9MUSC|nr:uncharacterized protein LOC119638316 isoform X2 [Glossina fuscipes]